jgi:hypothetical protein
LAATWIGLAEAAGAPGPAIDCRGPGAGARVVLAELFSTDACESCPPAEEAFNRLRAGAALAPVVWHVDYFDGPAWKDRFALPQAALRQQALARAQGLKTVATPQVFVDGLETGDWRDARAWHARLQRAAQAPAPEGGARLAIARVERGDGEARVDVRGESPRGDGAVVLQAVVVQGGLGSRPTGGENQGQRLEHEHVVRATSGPRPLADAGAWSVRLALPLPPDLGPGSPWVVVAWTQDAAARVREATWAACP